MGGTLRHLGRFAILLGLAIPAIAVTPSRAADSAQINILGFNADKSVFVFETFYSADPTDDGYSTYYFVDTRRDSWLANTPITASVSFNDPGRDESVDPVDLARANAAAEAAPLLAKLGPLQVGEVLASQALGQLTATPYRLAWREPIWGALPAMSETTHVLELQAVAVSASDELCEEFGGPKGMVLQLDGAVIRRDKAVPASRGFCIQDYFLSMVIGNVAIISTLGISYEGLDRRYIAVALPAPANP